MNIEEQKAKLLAHKQELESQLEEVAVADSENPGGYVAKEPDTGHVHTSDENDLADELEEMGNNNAITNDLETRLMHVNKALEHINAGTYGTCSECDKMIEEDRLEALPSAQTCKEHMA